jgi:hypothetical protein
VTKTKSGLQYERYIRSSVHGHIREGVPKRMSTDAYEAATEACGAMWRVTDARESSWLEA